MTMLSYIILTFVAIFVIFHVRDLVKPLSKKERKKFMLYTILIDLLLIIGVIYVLNTRSFDGADAELVAIYATIKRVLIPLFGISQMYIVLVIGMCFLYKNYEPIEEDEGE